jgi:flagellar biosynthesis protein FlhF
MRIKSYFVSSVEEAMAQAIAELGEDALLLRTRQTDGGYEVVFGSEDAEQCETPAADRSHDGAATVKERSIPVVSHSLETIRAGIDEIRQLLASPDRPRARVPELTAVFDRLTAAGIDDALADQIVDAVEAGMARHALAKLRVALGLGTHRFDLRKFEELLRSELSARIPINANLGVPGQDGTVVALVGPGGAGKTTTIMKIASFQAGPDRPVRILTLDHDSLASRMQLKLFARKAGVSFTALESPEELSSFLENARRKEIVFIDTPSCGCDADREKLARILNDCPAIDTHLVAPGYMTAPALRQSIAKYAVFRPAKLIITKLDESPAFGAAVSEAARAGLSISLLTNGVSIPRDLHAASVDDLLAIACARDQIRSCA